MKNEYSIPVFSVLLVIFMMNFVQPVYAEVDIPINTITIVGNFTFVIPVPDTPASIPAYRGILNEKEQIDYSPSDTILKSRPHVISKAEAWNATLKTMEKYGGLPPDAIFTGSGYTYETTYNIATNTSQKKPILITTSFIRKIDGRPIVGSPDFIDLDFGETTEPLDIYKRWHTIESAGFNFSVISVRMALEKVEKFDTMNSLSSPLSSNIISDYYPNATIKKMELGYRIPDENDPNHLYQPVWIIEGNWANGRPLFCEIYARQFADFIATPVAGSVPLTVAFNDTSIDPTFYWIWDFGDGTSSNEQNPVHVYNKFGTYTVTFDAENEYDSDIKTIENCITVYPQPSVLSIFDQISAWLNKLFISPKGRP